MFLVVIRLIRSAYPVLKESILGKQSIAQAWKRNKIKLATLLYCMVSPVLIFTLGDKTISLAKTTVSLKANAVISADQLQQCRNDLLVEQSKLKCAEANIVQADDSKQGSKKPAAHPSKKTHRHRSVHAPVTVPEKEDKQPIIWKNHDFY